MTITVEMEVRIMEDKEVGGFVSYCPAIDVYSQGDTPEEACHAVYEAVKASLEWQERRRRRRAQ